MWKDPVTNTVCPSFLDASASSIASYTVGADSAPGMCSFICARVSSAGLARSVRGAVTTTPSAICYSILQASGTFLSCSIPKTITGLP